MSVTNNLSQFWKGIFALPMLLCLLTSTESTAQQTLITDYVIFGGNAVCPGAGQSAPLAPGCGVMIGSSTTIQQGFIGSYKKVASTGNSTMNTSIFSGGTVDLVNSNVVSGRITAANSDSITGNAISTGSSLTLGGDIDAYGNVMIGGGSVAGKVTLSGNRTYSGPSPSGGLFYGTPSLPVLPEMPAISTLRGIPDNAQNITGTESVRPGVYGDVTLNGNKTLTLNGTGEYTFRSIKNSGTTNKFVFDFGPNNPNGKFKIYVKNDVDLNKVLTNIRGTGSANRVYVEVHGTGASSATGTIAFNVANGSAGSDPKWIGAVWAPYGGISLGAGTGSSDLQGALWSGTQVNVGSGVTIVFTPFSFCETPITANAGVDKPLDFSPFTTIEGSPTTGVTYNWQAINGGLISSANNTASITVGAAGTYILNVTGSSNTSCISRDTVVISGRLSSIIGSELQSIYDNNTSSSPFFVIQQDSVMIDVIVNTGYYSTVLSLIQTTPYGMRGILPNGGSDFIITGKYPIANLPKLNLLRTELNYCRPYYQGVSNGGLVTSAGDTSVRSYLVRNGYDLTGDGIKVGVISNSYNTISSSTTTPLRTNTAAQDIANGDLPGDTTLAGNQVINPNGFTKNVHVLKDYPGLRSDEGRAMLQIVHDVAPAAELYFHTGSLTAGDFAKGIRDLKIAGCKIIVDDITYMTEPFLKDGVIANAVDEVAGQGVTYFSAAGNFAGKSYENVYNPAPAPNGFTTGMTAHSFSGTDVFQSDSLYPGDYTFVLQWVDDIHSIGQGGTKHDLDIYLTPNTDGTSLFGFNRDNTNGDPVEFIPFTVTSPTKTNVLIVNNTIGSNPSRFKFIVFRGNIKFNEYETGVSTVIGQTNATGAIAIGAARYDRALPYPGPLTPESFSSTGGTFVNGVQRNKPELVGPDGVNTTVNMGGDYDNNTYSNFFGTSAAAPHAAAVSALIMQGRKKFLDIPVTTPAELKTLLQNTAISMRPAGLTGYDFRSGYGFINADIAMRTFAAPRPTLFNLVVPVTNPITIPGTVVFKVTVKGENFSTNSILYYKDSAMASTVILSSTEATAFIPMFTDNPPIKMYTPPYPNTITVNGQKLDGGFSNSLYFFDAQVTIIAEDKTKKYAETTPAFTSRVLVNNIPLASTNPLLTLADLGLTNITHTVPPIALNPGEVGTYTITPSKLFDQTSPTDVALLAKYRYVFQQGAFTIEQLPLLVTTLNSTATFGGKIPNTRFTYNLNGSYNIPDSLALLSSLSSAHQLQLAKDAQGNDVLGLVNGKAVTIENGKAITIENGKAVTIENGRAVTIENGVSVPVINAQALTIENGIVTSVNDYTLTNAQIDNLSFQATNPSLLNYRLLTDQTLVNGVYVQGNTTVVDLTQESILMYNVNAAQTYMLTSVSDVNAKGLVDVLSYENGKAITIENGKAITIENGIELTTVNGKAVVIENGRAVTIENGVSTPVVSSQHRNAVLVNQNEIGDGLSPLKSLNVISGLSAGTQTLVPGTLSNKNFLITYKPGVVTINNSPCLITHSPDKNFGSTANPGTATSLWLNIVTKISGQLTTHGDYLLFRDGAISFTNVISNPLVNNRPIPTGKIIADNGVSVPVTSYDASTSTWTTKVPPGFASTSDIFVSGVIINSSTGFAKQNNVKTIAKGMFYSNRTYTDQWAYASAAYQPQFTYPSITTALTVVSVNGTYRAGTPLINGAPINYLVNGGSGGGGNNYSGSTNSYDKFSACLVAGTPTGSFVARPAAATDDNIVAEQRADVDVTPNPATDFVNVSFVPGENGAASIGLYTLDGKKIFEQGTGLLEAGFRYVRKINVSGLRTGVYVIHLKGRKEIVTKKIIISH